MEGNIAATYALVYRFLKQQTQNKAAEAVKKAAKGFVILREDVEQEGPSLEDIIKEWRSRQCTKSDKDADSSSEESETSDGASSDSEDCSGSDSSSEDTSGSESENDDTSDSDNSSRDSNEGATVKKLPIKGAERDTSVTLSSAGENARERTKQVTKIAEKESTKDRNKGSESDSSESDSSNSDSLSESTALRGSDPKTPTSSDSSGSSDSSDEDEANSSEKVPSNTTRTTENKKSGSESSSGSEDDSDTESQQSEDAHVVKKRKTSESGIAVKLQQTEKGSQKKERTPPKVKVRFQRVKVQSLAPELLLNNGYEARGGVANDYGERAHRDLVVTRGAGFRKEKNKKKRGSYRGGEITMENHSIKFDF